MRGHGRKMFSKQRKIDSDVKQRTFQISALKIHSDSLNLTKVWNSIWYHPCALVNLQPRNIFNVGQVWGRNTGELSPEVSLPHPGTSKFHLSKSYQNKHLIKNCKTHESKISLRRDGQKTDRRNPRGLQMLQLVNTDVK